MPVAKNTDYTSATEYLATERHRETRHEYADGRIYAMAGDSPNHGRISSNISSRFTLHLLNTPCEVFSADMKVKTPTGQYRYPDVLVLCDNQFIDEGYATQTPSIIVEVISRSTRRTDEKIKQLEYINIPTLKEYVLIEQDIVDIKVLRKSNDWRTSHYFLGEEIYFEAIDLTLSVADIYHRVENQDMTDFLASR